MAAGTHYDLNPVLQEEELYRIDTGVKKIGPWKLDTTNLVAGSYLPVFTPVEVSMTKRTISVVRNVRVVEAYKTADEKTTIKITKNSLAYANMFLGDGKKGCTVSSIDKSNADYDVLNIATAFASDIAVGDILFESTAAGGTVKKNTANYVLYARTKVDFGGTYPTLLIQAYGIMEHKLVLPIHTLDKNGLTSRFEWDY